MRWDNLKIDAESAGEAARLPGYRDDAVVRRFDAPEALDMRFYEVRAKSALNKVPDASRMPFRWTINPYRGCSHACTYCAHPETPVLMADGRHRPIGELRAGDRIYGTVQRGTSRTFVETEVRARWSTIKPAYRVTLADGTELVASGDHRFLTERGWKHVTGTEQGALRRPHLTLGSALAGTGAFTAPPARNEDYERGYLCGLLRGDGTIGHRDHVRRSGSRWAHHSFRLALADPEALERAQAYLESTVGRLTLVAHAAAGRRPMQMLRTQTRDVAARVEQLVAWPADASPSWRKGFLAGVFDAEGHRRGAVLRIAGRDAELIGRTAECLRFFGFDVIVEDRLPANGLQDVRVRGGLPEHLRFIHLVDPAIRRKCSIEGHAVRTDANLGVVAIEPLGGMRLVDITTGTGDFIANGVVSHNCFARPTHKYLDMNAGRDFEREIVVKVNVPEILRAELRRPSWKGEHVALGTNTDPYQWVESRYRLMPGIWEALRDARNPCSVLTKSPLLLRDLDLMREIAAVTSITANLSVPTLDRATWRATEPHTPNPRARLEAVAELNRAGIPTGVLVAPLMPGINDDPRQVEAILEAAAEAGATGIGGVALHLRGDVRGVFMDWLRSQRPDLVARYEELYAAGAYAPQAERRRLAALLDARSQPAAAPFGRDPDFHVRPAGAMRRVADPVGQGGSAGRPPAAERRSAAELRLTADPGSAVSRATDPARVQPREPGRRSSPPPASRRTAAAGTPREVPLQTALF